MVPILSLATSSEVCSVALHTDGELIVLKEVHSGQSHASRLAGLIQDVLTEADISAKQLAAVAVDGGPGSFTGLRIGVSTAKGICAPLGIPLISKGSLDIMTADVKEDFSGIDFFCPMVDARRMEVYYKIFDREMNTLSPTQALVVEANSFDKWKEGKIIFFGSGALKCKPILKHLNAQFSELTYPGAEVLGKIAFKHYQGKVFEDLSSFEPFYLKPSNARETLRNG